MTTVEQLPADLAAWPAWTPPDAQLGELELLLSGAYDPLTGYLGAADAAAVTARRELADGTPWPVPVTLTVPAAAVPEDAVKLVLQDPEGSPLALLDITERSFADAASSSLRLAGPVTALRAPEHGPFRAMRRVPAEVRADLGDGLVLALATRRPLTRRHVGQLRHVAGQLRSANGAPVRILLLPLVAGPAAVVVRPEALVRSVLAAAGQLPEGTVVVPVPLPPRDNPETELAAQAVVAGAYGATHVLSETGTSVRSDEYKPFGVEVIAQPEWAYDPQSEVWRPLSLIEAGMERGELSDAELGSLLDSGETVPAWLVPGDVAAELRRARPPRSSRGLVVFFTGLSGSGKSTLARDLRDALLERGDRTVSL
ncbi:MAG: adenylyl-sulfate kinase, partial [Trebonia sp.]